MESREAFINEKEEENIVKHFAKFFFILPLLIKNFFFALPCLTFFLNECIISNMLLIYLR